MQIIESDINLKYMTQKYLAHGVSCDGKMPDVGSAAILRKTYPKMTEEYTRLCAMYTNKQNELLGMSQYIDCGDKIIINLYIQESYGSSRQPLDLEILRKCFIGLNNHAKENNVTEIAMPKIGTGGSESWDSIKAIIEETSLDYQPIVCIKSK